MPVLAVVALVAAVAAMCLRPTPAAWWAAPSAIGVAAVAAGVVPWEAAGAALGVMRDPLLFLACAVPLAAALDRLGVFAALAATISGGRHLTLSLWVLAAVVTALLNLDAAVVLLTPLYVRLALMRSLPVEALAFQPALLACLASHPLPVSNLTNLIVAEQADLTTTDFLRHLGPATVVTVAVGWFAYRRTFGLTSAAGAAVATRPDRRALRLGVPILAFAAIGFAVADRAHLPAWAVAAVALVWACAVDRSIAPVRSLPVPAVALAASLAVLVAGAAAHLPLARLLHGDGLGGRLRALAVGSVLSDATNNLPAVLATAPFASPDQVWPLLFAVNAAPAFVLTGALSSLLWRDTVGAAGLVVTPRRFAAVGLRVAAPAFAAGALVVLLAP